MTVSATPTAPDSPAPRGRRNRPTRTPRPPRATTPRRFSFRAVLLGAICTITALITLLGLAPIPVVPEAYNLTLAQLSSLLVRFVTIIGAISVVIGVLNLLVVNVRKMGARSSGAGYSLFTLLGFLIVLIVYVGDRVGTFRTFVQESSVETTGRPVVSLTLLDSVQVAIEAALGGLLFFSLVYAAARLLRKQANVWNVLFIIALLIVLIGYIPLANLGVLATIRDWVLRVPVSAGTRGLLIGVALGTVIVGLRLLVGQDRSFRD
jgi:magnesium-transporting ATPase (P-type)